MHYFTVIRVGRIHNYDAHQMWGWYWREFKTEFITVDTHKFL